MKDLLVIIPVYKDKIDEFEKKSLLQCRRTLLQYQFAFIAPTSLSLAEYNLQEKIDIVKRFDPSFFTSVQSYNILLTSQKFYSTFKDYDFILIYQLDAYVFKDELSFWINKGYDFIGAPWFSDFAKATDKSVIIGVGNGGFSLRNNHKAICIIKRLRYLKLLDRYIFMYGLYNYLTERKNNQLSKIIRFYFSINNNPAYLTELLINRDANEDGYWSIWVASTFSDYVVAPFEEAMKFSFEVNPSLLFKLNNQVLPFGCHGWRKYEYNSFWKKYILRSKI